MINNNNANNFNILLSNIQSSISEIYPDTLQSYNCKLSTEWKQDKLNQIHIFQKEFYEGHNILLDDNLILSNIYNSMAAKYNINFRILESLFQIKQSSITNSYKELGRTSGFLLVSYSPLLQNIFSDEFELFVKECRSNSETVERIYKQQENRNWKKSLKR